MNERWVTLRAPALADARFEVLSLEGEERLNTLPTLTVDLRAVDAGVVGNEGEDLTRTPASGPVEREKIWGLRS